MERVRRAEKKVERFEKEAQVKSSRTFRVLFYPGEAQALAPSSDASISLLVQLQESLTKITRRWGDSIFIPFPSSSPSVKDNPID